MTARHTEPGTGPAAPVAALLTAVGAGDQRATRALLTEDYVLVEPRSLPWGGEHHGPDRYLAVMQHIAARFDLDFAVHTLAAVPGTDLVVLRSDVTFTSRGTAPERSVQIPTTEWFTVRGKRIARSEVHLSDTAALLALLHDEWP